MKGSIGTVCRAVLPGTNRRPVPDRKAICAPSPKKAGDKVVGVWIETASGAKGERTERKRVLALAQARKIDVILVTELTRWGRSMLDLFRTLQDYRPGTCRWWLRTGLQSISIARREN